MADHRVLPLDIGVTGRKGEQARLVGAVVDRQFGELVLWAVLVAEPGQPVKVTGPNYWLVDGDGVSGTYLAAAASA